MWIHRFIETGCSTRCSFSQLKMCIMFGLAQIISIWIVAAQGTQDEATTINIEDYGKLLQETTLEVLLGNDGPPLWVVHYMYSFQANTGYGNREDLGVDQLRRVHVYGDSSSSSWRYKRFNSLDYLMGVSERNVVVWSKRLDTNKPLELFLKDSLFQHTIDLNETIVDAMFTRHDMYMDVLQAVVLIQSRQSRFIRTFELLGNTGPMAIVNDIGIKRSSSPPITLASASKITYIHTKQGNSLVVLTPTAAEFSVIYNRKGSSNLRYVEVQYPSPVDLLSFTITGQGYLAITNATTCEVYKMDEFVQRHFLFERIQFEETIVDLEKFRFGFKHYLVVSSQNFQALYVWTKKEFSKAQEFFNSEVQQVHAASMPNCQDDTILFFLKNRDVPEIFIWNAKMEKFVAVTANIPRSFQPLMGSITSFNCARMVCFLFVNNVGQTELIAMTIRHAYVSDPLLLIGNEVSELMQELQRDLDEQQKIIKSISAILKNSVRPAGNQKIATLQTFNHIWSTNDVLGNFVHDEMNISWNGSEIDLNFMFGIQNIESKVGNVEKRISLLERGLSDALFLDDAATITGAKIFMGDIYSSSVFSRSLNIRSTGIIDILNLQKIIYRLDKAETIEGKLKFQKTINIAGELDVNSVNGIDISEDAMNTWTDQTSHADVFFKNFIVHGNFNVSGKLNELDVDSDVVSLDTDVRITGKKVFWGGLIADNTKIKIMDNLHIDQYHHQALTNNRDQHIWGTTHFRDSFHSVDIVLPGTFSSFDISELAENIVRVDKPDFIFGAKTFVNNVIVRNSLMVKDTINSLNVPDDVFLKYRINAIIKPKAFYGGTTISNFVVIGTVDGRSPAEIITLTQDEIISKLHFIDGITVKGDLIVGATVDDLNISEFVKDLLDVKGSTEINNTIFLGAVTISGNLNVISAINGIILRSLVEDIVWNNESHVVLDAEKYFEMLRADYIKLKWMINGFNIEMDFMTVKGDQVLDGGKFFEDSVDFQNIEIADVIFDGMNITHLYRDRTTLAIPQQLPANMRFANHLVINGNLTCRGPLSGISYPNEVVLKSKDLEISNKVFKEKVNIQSLFIEQNAEVQSVAQVDLKKFFHERIALSTDQVIESEWTVINSKAIEIDISAFVNGLNISEFRSDIMSLTKNQTLVGHKQFLGNANVYGSVTTDLGINGINLLDLNLRTFKLYYDNISAPLTFQDAIFQNLIAHGLIDGVNITKLGLESVKMYGHQYIQTVTTFNGGLNIKGDVTTISFNGLNVAKDIVTKTTNQIIAGRFTLMNIEVMDDLYVTFLINGMDISEVTNILAKTDKSNLIDSDIVFHSSVEVYREIKVSGSVNGVYLKHLEHAALSKNRKQSVTGHKIIRGNVTVFGNIEVKFVDSVLWYDFVQDVVRIDMPQIISGSKKFVSEFEVDGDVVVNSFANLEFLNEINFTLFLNDGIFIEQPANITGTKIFTSFIEISNDLNSQLINSLNLKKDVIILQCNDNGLQIVTGRKTFLNLTMLEDIAVHGNISGGKLPIIVANTLSVEWSQHIIGTKTFRNPVRFVQDIYPSYVNNLEISLNLITLHTDQDLAGPLFFKKDVHMNRNLYISGFLNHIDTKKLARQAVYVDTDQAIEGIYYIHHAAVKYDIFADGTTNGINLNDFFVNVTTYLSQRNSVMNVLMRTTHGHCEVVDHLNSRLKNAYSVLEGFILHQTLRSSTDNVQLEQSGMELSLIDLLHFEPSAISYHYQWDAQKKLFVISRRNQKTNVLKKKFFKFENHDIVIVIGVNVKESVVLLDGVRLSAIPGGFIDADIAVISEIAFVSLLYPTRKICEVYEISISSSTIVKASGKIKIGGGTAVTMFEMMGVIHMAVSSDFTPSFSQDSSKLFSLTKNGWQLVQNFPASASSYVSHFVHNGYNYLAFTNAMPVYETKEPKSIQVYRNSVFGYQFSLFQKVPFDNADSIEVFRFGEPSELYLTVFNKTKIQVFHMEGEAGFKSNVTLHGSCISSVKPVVLGNEVYLAVGEKNSLVFKGLTLGSAVLKTLTCS